MRVLHLISEKTWRGGEQQAAYLIEYAMARGIPTFVACRANSAFARFCQSRDIPYLSVRFNSEYDIFTCLRIKRFCRKQKINLIHIHSGKAHGIAVLSHLLGNKIPLVLSRRIPRPAKANRLARYKYNYPAITKVISVSDAINCMMRNCIDRPEKCITIHSGVDTNMQATDSVLEQYRSQGELLIGTVAALVWHKGLFTFIKAAQLALQAGIKARFLIIGEGPLESKLAAYIQHLDLCGQIIMTGYVPNVKQQLAALDIFVLTSNEEGLGTSILDAMVARVPVVATATGGIPQMVIDEETGLLAPVGDAQRIASAFLALAKAPEHAQTLADNAYARVCEYFDKDKMARETIGVYEEVA